MGKRCNPPVGPSRFLVFGATSGGNNFNDFPPDGDGTSLPGGGTTTLGGGTAISGGGTPDTGGGTPFRLILTTASGRWLIVGPTRYQ